MNRYMNRYPKVGEDVEVIVYKGKDFVNDKFGTVICRDGEYIDIKLHKSGVVVECYPCELKEILPL